MVLKEIREWLKEFRASPLRAIAFAIICLGVVGVAACTTGYFQTLGESAVSPDGTSPGALPTKSPTKSSADKPSKIASTSAGLDNAVQSSVTERREADSSAKTSSNGPSESENTLSTAPRQATSALIIHAAEAATVDSGGLVLIIPVENPSNGRIVIRDITIEGYAKLDLPKPAGRETFCAMNETLRFNVDRQFELMSSSGKRGTGRPSYAGQFSMNSDSGVRYRAEVVVGMNGCNIPEGSLLAIKMAVPFAIEADSITMLRIALPPKVNLVIPREINSGMYLKDMPRVAEPRNHGEWGVMITTSTGLTACRGRVSFDLNLRLCPQI